MTLIMSAHSNGTAIGISDIAITGRGKSKGRTLFHNLEDNAFSNLSINNFCRKCWELPENAIMQWSGKYYKALMFYNQYAKSNNYYVAIAAIKKRHGHQFWNDLSIICSFPIGEKIITEEINCTTHKDGDTRLLYSGTGGFPFVEGGLDHERSIDDFRQIGGIHSPNYNYMCRVVVDLLLTESLSGSNLAYSTGGWLEFFANDGKICSMLQYTVSFWNFDPNRGMTLRGFCFSKYFGNDLLAVFVRTSNTSQTQECTRAIYAPKLIGKAERNYVNLREIGEIEPDLSIALVSVPGRDGNYFYSHVTTDKCTKVISGNSSVTLGFNSSFTTDMATNILKKLDSQKL